MDTSQKGQDASEFKPGILDFGLHSCPKRGSRYTADWMSVHCRVEGLKRVTSVAVGEKHSLALQSWCQAPSFHAASSAPVVGQGLVSEPSHSLEENEPGTLTTKGRQVHSLMSDAYWAELDASSTEALEEGLPDTHLQTEL